ncbi:FxLYD domain-containing protein [Geomicrobium sp. JSM 1781026]|uniref:FxLYD domain-containing protein n=1 Tax=Geomicrobium sp. JSM 1781026 TaxID=3344580 RepID=UPI0035BF56B5
MGEGVIGRAENQTDEFVDMVDVAVATYDDAEELLSITFSYIETLKPGQTQTFEAYLNYYPYSLSEVADVDVRGYGYVFEE